MDISKLVSKHTLVSNQVNKESLSVVLENLQKVLSSNIKGDVVELGCYIGTTSLFIKRLLANEDQASRQFHVYDSFDGLPDKTSQDQSSVGVEFKEGELKVSKKDFVLQFKKAGLQPPLVHKAWFDDLTEADLPDKIAFAFLDGDFYESILTSLKLVWPKMNVGGIICIDDYKREALPGVERAIIDFFGSDRDFIKKSNIGIFIKK